MLYRKVRMIQTNHKKIADETKISSGSCQSILTVNIEMKHAYYNIFLNYGA